MPARIPTDGEVEPLLQEARKDPNYIMKIEPTTGGMQMYTNFKPFGNPRDPLACKDGRKSRAR